MTANEIGLELVRLCKEGKNLECIDTFYSPDIESIEAHAPPGASRTMKGIDAIHGKHQWWTDNHIVHKAEVFGPYPHGDDRFAVRFVYDITLKPANKRFAMDEVAVFYVKGDKIGREEFFYQGG